MSYAIGSAPSSFGGAGSNGKRMSRRYRTLNSKSEVDENLFGLPERVKMAQQMRENKNRSQPENEKFTSPDRSRRSPPREYVKHITKDLIRDILIPEDTTPKSVVIDKETYQRLLKSCQYKTKEKSEQEKTHKEQITDRLISEINQRRKLIQQYDAERKNNEKLSDIDQMAQEEAENLLKKANELRQEEEDEIKYLNELILDAKVHAIRDAQIEEKHQIRKEVKDEQKRLDMMMEVDRLNSIKIQEEIEKKRRYDLQEGAKVILKQIEENRQEKILKDEMREQENETMIRYLEQLQKEDWEEVKKRKEQQKKLAGELLVANKEMEKQKEQSRQQEILADLKVLEYQKQKAAKDAAFEAEQERKRMDREREVARLRAQQERARDLQAEKDALRAKREQERKEREWRDKERMDALKKKKSEEEMRLAREWQIRNKEHYLAIEAAKDRAEFQKILKAQLELAEKERDEETKQRSKQKKFNENLQKQIRENELVRIQERKAFFEEGLRLDQEARLRRARLDEIKRKKLDELKLAGIPDKYCAEIERKINGTINVKA